MIHISNVINKPETITYWREPTKEEIKFGYGTLHYKDFEFDKCFDQNGYLKLKVRASDDKLIYFEAGTEYFTTRKAVMNTIKV